MDNKTLTKLIDDWLKSDKYTKMIQGMNYYLNNNDINNREFFLYTTNDQRQKDKYRANVKVNNGFLGILIDQKISYCLGQDIVIEDFESAIDINETIDEVGEEASQKGIGWGFVYIDELGEIKVKCMESENIIPIYDNTIEKKLTGIIRTYEIDEIKHAEYWTKDDVTTFELKNNIYEVVTTDTHLNDSLSWGIIPFVPLCNNRYETTDLEKVKPLVDAYDLVISDFANNFIDFQELILYIKNYAENVATEQAAAELMDWIKKYKVVSVKQDGSMDILAREVPHEARSEFLSILKKNIFLFGRGVDMDELKGSSLTNVAIEAHFAGLDLKANKFIKECKKYIKKILMFTNKRDELSNKGRQQEINQVKITINKSTIINIAENVDNCLKSDGIISRKTIVSNHPWVDDVEEELKQIDEDELKYAEDPDFPKNTENFGVDEE